MLNWVHVEGATSYTVTYAKDQAFTKEVKTIKDIKTDLVTINDLSDNSTYYMRVTANKGKEVSRPSGILSVELYD